MKLLRLFSLAATAAALFFAGVAAAQQPIKVGIGIAADRLARCRRQGGAARDPDVGRGREREGRSARAARSS